MRFGLGFGQGLRGLFVAQSAYVIDTWARLTAVDSLEDETYVPLNSELRWSRQHF